MGIHEGFLHYVMRVDRTWFEVMDVSDNVSTHMGSDLACESDDVLDLSE